MPSSRNMQITANINFEKRIEEERDIILQKKVKGTGCRLPYLTNTVSHKTINASLYVGILVHIHPLLQLSSHSHKYSHFPKFNQVYTYSFPQSMKVYLLLP